MFILELPKHLECRKEIKMWAAETLLQVVLQKMFYITLYEQNVQVVLWEEEAKNVWFWWWGQWMEIFREKLHFFCSATCYLFCFWHDSPPGGQGLPIHEVSISQKRRTTVDRTPLDEWSARRRDLYLTTHVTLTTDKRPCPQWDSNPQSQQASGRRPTTSTARPLRTGSHDIFSFFLSPGATTPVGGCILQPSGGL